MTRKTQTKREPSVVQRIADILLLFSDDRPSIELKDAVEVLGLSQPTAYRYLREMHEVGLLSRTAGRFMPGPKFIELGFLIGRFDPLIVSAREPIQQLSEDTGCEILLGRLYDIRLVNVLSTRKREESELNFAPGRTVPLFRGSQARAVLSAMDRRTRRRVFDLGEGDPNRDFIGTDWKSFNSTLQKNKTDGYYVSKGELDRDVTGVASAVYDEANHVLGSIVAVYRGDAPPAGSLADLIQAVRNTAAEISFMLQPHNLT